MEDDDVRKMLSPQERWHFDKAVREAERERLETTNADGSPRVTYVAGPWTATVDALREIARLRVRISDYESGCRHAWKALPTEYDYVIDECIPADKIGNDDAYIQATREAGWLEIAIRDMAGDLARSRQNR